MSIPLSSPDLGPAEIEAVLAVLRSNRLSLGPELEKFEAAMAELCETRFAVACSSGTSALHLMMLGLGIGEGDEVITSSFSFVASANAALYVGATPVLADIEPHSLNLDPASVEAAITPKTKAILAVHIFGRPADMSALRALAETHGLLLLEDACEALGAKYKDRVVGGIGEAGAFGFYPNKTITTGEGGMLVTSNPELAQKAKSLRNQGREVPSQGHWLDHVELGYNYRLSDIQCALGSAQLARLPEIMELRTKVAGYYEAELAQEIRVRCPRNEAADQLTLSWFVYVIQLNVPPKLDARTTRDRVWEYLQSKGIGCGRYFAPIHLQPQYIELSGHQSGRLPVTESSADRCLALPFFNRLQAFEVNRVVAVLKEALDIVFS